MCYILGRKCIGTVTWGKESLSVYIVIRISFMCRTWLYSY